MSHDDPVRRLVLLVVIVGLMTSCAGADESPGPVGLGDRWEEDPAEPYPFSGEVPPLESTTIDGVYVRRAPLRDVGAPVPCRRCPPYKIYAGEARLRLERGRFHIDEDGSQFGSEGHYVVEGDEITFFNDPICPSERVTYEYRLEDGVLTFAFQRDPCAFQNLRGKYLTTYPWRARAPGAAS